jgi:hypothetical protein
MSVKIPKTLCEKCLQSTTEYLGLNGRPGDSSNPWECLNENCEQDEKDLLALINPKENTIANSDLLLELDKGYQLTFTNCGIIK